MGGGGGGASWKLKKAARKLFVQTCGSFCQTQQPHLTATQVPYDPSKPHSPPENRRRSNPRKIQSEIAAQSKSSTSPSSNKSLCAICLDPLNYSSGSGSGQAIFTAQCSHSFHFSCISSNVRHGSITCPICRAHWTQLPRNLNFHSTFHNKTGPVVQILDDSIADSRVHRRSFLQSARYNDDDPIDPDPNPISPHDRPRLFLSILPVPLCHPASDHETSSYLHVKLSHRPATDLVLVASPNGPHLRLMKQAMATVVSSLRPVDRLTIVTYTSAAARVFPLRRMTPYGKRNALQVIERLFYMGRADPIEGLKKGVKILEDRVHKNPQSSILHLTDTPSGSHHWFDTEVQAQVQVQIHRFHVRFGFGAPNAFATGEFEEFLARTVGGCVADLQLRIGDGLVVRIGEMRGGEERNIPLCVGECGRLCVEYSYREGECVRTGELLVGVGEKGDGSECGDGVRGSVSSAENWDFHDPFMARRWAKHLHGYRL